MTTPLAELLAAVPTLNEPDEPFAYEVRDGTIVGSWDIVRATTLYPTEIESINKDYQITATLDAAKNTYEFNERKTSSEGSISADGASFSKDFFSGKSTSKEFSFSFGGVSKTDDGVSIKPVAYTFSTSRIKDPLFAFLKEHGWQRKKSLLSGLFNR
ncbi:MAG: Ca2+/Na+ antiporter [Aeromicrobium sp.]|nr:Ca2+/Na+ antiporter [Aeromicrobium sp.]